MSDQKFGCAGVDVRRSESMLRQAGRHAICRIYSEQWARNYLVLERDAISAGGVAVVGASPVLQHALPVPAAHDAKPRVVLHRHHRVTATTIKCRSVGGALSSEAGARLIEYDQGWIELSLKRAIV